jgi:hypothetical protein
MGGNLLYADRSYIECINVFHSQEQVHFLPYQPHQSRLEAPCNVRDLDHQYLKQGACCGGGKLD